MIGLSAHKGETEEEEQLRLKKLDEFLKMRKVWLQQHDEVHCAVASALEKAHFIEVNKIIRYSPGVLTLSKCPEVRPAPFIIVQALHAIGCDPSNLEVVKKLLQKLATVAPITFVKKITISRKDRNVYDYAKFLFSNAKGSKKECLETVTEELSHLSRKL